MLRFRVLCQTVEEWIGYDNHKIKQVGCFGWKSGISIAIELDTFIGFG